MTIKKYANKYKDQLYFVFRVLIGLMFMQHGAQKLFGVFGSKGAVELFSLMGVVGVIEFAGGLLIAFGLFTRIAAAVSAIVMASVYFKVHASNGLMPIVNKGELALVYFAAFLAIIALGAGKWNLEKVLFKKKK